MIIDKLNTLESIAGRNDKLNVLVDYLHQDAVFYDVCRLALDSLINFGIRTWPSIETNNLITVDFQSTIKAIENLAGSNHSSQLIEDIMMIVDHCQQEEREVVKRIMLKDLRCGVQIATVNKAIEMCNKKYGTSYQKIFDYPCMLTSAFDQKKADKLFDGQELFCQQKCDGMRFNAVVESNGNVNFYGRSGKPITIPDREFAQLFRILSNGDDVVFDGELLIDGTADGDAVERSTGNGILNRAVRGTMTGEEAKRVTAVLWDQIPLVDFRKGKSTAKYFDRFQSLADRLTTYNLDRVFLVQNWMITNQHQADRIFGTMIERGREGIIVKSPNNIWKDTRATDCIKFKAELDIDLLCVEAIDISNGQPKMGSIRCVSSDGNLQVGVGSGFTDADRIEFYKNPPIGKIITVRYNAIIKDEKTGIFSLFLPRFIEVREDKDVADSLN